MSDEDLGSFLVRHEEKRAELRRQSSTSEEYRILLINHWLNTFHTPTWEYLAGKCFLSKKEIPLRKIKEHFERMPGSFYRNLSFCSDVFLRIILTCDCMPHSNKKTIVTLTMCSICVYLPLSLSLHTIRVFPHP